MRQIRWILEALILGGVFVCAFRFPGAWGGALEPLAALLFPLLLLEAAFRGRRTIFLYAACLAGLVALLHWVPATLASKGGLSQPVALLGGLLFWAYEALGLLGVILLARRGARKGPWAAAFCAAFGILVWEGFAFHIYTWSWGAAFGSLPFLARSAAFLGTRGLAALAWGSGAWAAAHLASDRPQRAWAGPVAALGLMSLLGGAWFLLPKGHERRLDVAVVQPDFPAGERFPGMLEEGFRRSEELLAYHHLPRPDRPTLLLWSESSVMDREHSLPDPQVTAWAADRRVALLFGTEGGRPGVDASGRPRWEPALLNLVRGEVAGRPPFLQAKVVPMAFGERMPGPEPMRKFLDRTFGLRSQEPGELGADSAFVVPGVPMGTDANRELASVAIDHPRAADLRVHPLVCSEALLPDRSREGALVSRAELLTNHTNDNWFETSPATFLHTAQIRLRAAEVGLPLVRATLGGASGIFREDGRFTLWSGPRTQGAWAFELAWRPVKTPARSGLYLGLLWALTALGAILSLLRKQP